MLGICDFLCALDPSLTSSKIPKLKIPNATILTKHNTNPTQIQNIKLKNLHKKMLTLGLWLGYNKTMKINIKKFEKYLNGVVGDAETLPKNKLDDLLHLCQLFGDLRRATADAAMLVDAQCVGVGVVGDAQDWGWLRRKYGGVFRWGNP